jgi:hypothetical protein
MALYVVFGVPFTITEVFDGYRSPLEPAEAGIVGGRPGMRV